MEKKERKENLPNGGKINFLICFSLNCADLDSVNP